MKFTAEPDPFLRIIEMLAERGPGKRRTKTGVTLIASDGRLWVKQNGTTARTEAVVRRDGQCTVDGTRLLRAIKQNSDARRLSLEAGVAGLRLGDTVIPVAAYSPVAAPPGKFQIFLTTDLGVVPSQPWFLKPAEVAIAG